MKYSTLKKGVYFAVMLLLLSGSLAACSIGSSQSRNGGNTSTTTQSTNPNAVATTVNVTTTEMSFTFDPQPTKAGKITFIITNQGNTEHNFVIQGNGRDYGTPMIPPGSSQSLTVELAPGSYDFVCAVPGHGLLGMRGSFTLN